MKKRIETPPACQWHNLLDNPGFENGSAMPKGWSPVRPGASDMIFTWDEEVAHSGSRSVRIQGVGSDCGVWQQVVDVEPGRVYALAGYVAFKDLASDAMCNLQAVFRDAQGSVLQTVDYPGHFSGSRGFAYDFPHEHRMRAPAGSAQAEINLCLAGSGTAWFDDVFFGPVPTGDISGVVTSDDQPLDGVRVLIWGDPWDKKYEALTDGTGCYRLSEVPVAYPRYLLCASKDGHRTQIIGKVDVIKGKIIAVDFDLAPGIDPDDLRVKFGSLEYTSCVDRPVIPEGATIPSDASGYPSKVGPYLEADEFINPTLPGVAELAQEILASLPIEHRSDTRKVVWAIYEWLVRYIEHNSVYSPTNIGTNLHGGELQLQLRQAYRDVTSGRWQLLAQDGWGWGKSFYDWTYSNDEVLDTRGAICIELAWLAASLCRRLNIPARASVGSYEFWAQLDRDHGLWVHQSIAGGRAAFRKHGRVGEAFEGGPPEGSFSVLSRPILQEDWNAQHPGPFRERHPWTAWYEGSPAGYERALADLKHFAATGDAPLGTKPVRWPDPAAEPDPDRHIIFYSDVTINLFNMGEQRILDVRFPMGSEGGIITPTWNVLHWTNHPECVRRTWFEEIPNPPAEGAERWYHVEFDLTSLLE